MKPAAFELETAYSLEEALALLSTNRDVKLLAGGQSLVPLMNFRLARPAVLVDLNRVKELDYIRVNSAGGGLAIGAMTRQRVLEHSAVVAERTPLVSEVLPWVGHPPIRNRGTMGGSLAHADSAAELCVAALALDATLVAMSGSAGMREIGVQDFFVGPFTTALRADEILTEVRLPAVLAGCGWAFEEVARRKGDFAVVAVAAVLQVDSSQLVRHARLAYLSMGPTPMRAPLTEQSLNGQPATEQTFAEAAESAVSELNPEDDLHASAAYRLHVAKALTRRALNGALDRAVTARPVFPL
jgi:aerobic carbon-monoxide dehydrogenase medium subunit